MSDRKPEPPSNEPREEAEPQTSVFTIGKMAKQYNMTFRTLRFYESIGLLHPARDGTTRLYSMQDCRRLEMTLRGRMLGFSLAEIHSLIESQSHKSEETNLEFMLGSEQITAQIRSLERQRDDLDKAIQCLRQAYEKVTGSKIPPRTENNQSSS
jgi:DNA-binding transcriptional MerR regulator